MLYRVEIGSWIIEAIVRAEQRDETKGEDGPTRRHNHGEGQTPV
jgi:hypothetical protein